ncbi:Regulator of telomere elongation helicase 1 [Merluccius polli]|uniref:Regulator of telomere elongation helicase 1 n=1 Tax=Merluccius polli TaxID=89951 RepID=A0AA47N189_MERPO|nr:Regulator of telomere elongation helicase 1 [Merluccius polli]
MPSLTLRGVTINFPFTPYECQNDYMSKVIECLQQKVNGVLESPTGTGKTLCLLCATLAWRDHFKDTISARKIAERLKGAELFPDTVASWGTAATDGDGTTYYTDIPKIIYASRTHSQLSQVINELKNTSYRPKVCVLGSREQMCIHPEVMRQESNHVKVHMCKAKVASRSCVFYNNLEEKSTDKELVNTIMDVEDLVKAGVKQRFCPYYLSRTLKTQADIIFMPYNYLLDPKSRRAQNIDLKGAVIIFDEAHNVEKMCEESTSFDLTPYDLTSAIEVVNNVLMEQAKEASSGEPVADNFGSGSLSSEMLLDLEAVIDSYEVSSEKGLTKPGSFIFELFQKVNLTFRTKHAMADALEQIISYVTGKTGIFMNTSGLQKLVEILQLVFCGEPEEGNNEKRMQANTSQFKVHIHKDTSSYKNRQKTDVWASSSSKKQGTWTAWGQKSGLAIGTFQSHPSQICILVDRYYEYVCLTGCFFLCLSDPLGNILSYWCFSPGFSMQDLVHQGVRSIILTSGTLSPLLSFTAEMQIPFPVALENSHVIQRDQIFVGVVDQGPDGVQLSSAFDRRFVPENMASLGNTVANFGRVVPHGLLVFFPSYPVMDKTLDFWKENGHAQRIENMKPMFVEPRGKSNFNDVRKVVIEGYYNQVNDTKSKGGSFFAVCRGKASEGLDFSDNFGRAVIITGLPFPPKMDPRVILKMQFLDETSRKKLPGVKCLSGSEWYRQQASRAVNQAIGRVIRHKEDYGAIFLCDRRFKNIDAQAQLPSWLRPHVRRYENFGNLVRDVTQFFRVAQKLRPLVDKAIVGSDSVRVSETKYSSASSCTQSSSSRIQKAKAMDSHVPSLKRKRLNEHTGGDGMARLSIQYNTEMQSTQRPGTLMDALVHSDKHHGREEEGIAGEEMASCISTRSLQHDKHLDDRFRGGKRKIKLVQDPKMSCPSGASEENTHVKAKRFLTEMRKSLSQMNYQRVMDSLQAYKRQDDLTVLQTEAAVLLVDANTHVLFRLYQFLRPHHKKLFDEKCQELTGHGCGYKPGDSLSKEEKEALVLQQTANKGQPGVSSHSGLPGNQLNTSLQLNKGGQHLGVHVSSGHLHIPGQTGDAKGPSDSFLADVKETFGAEMSNQLLLAIRRYEKDDNYESLITTAVGLLTQKDDNLVLLERFERFVHPHHKKLFKEMLGDLKGKPAQTTSMARKTHSAKPNSGLVWRKVEKTFPSRTPPTSQFDGGSIPICTAHYGNTGANLSTSGYNQKRLKLEDIGHM